MFFVSLFRLRKTHTLTPVLIRLNLILQRLQVKFRRILGLFLFYTRIDDIQYHLGLTKFVVI